MILARLSRLLNVGLRAVTLISKFALLFFLARYLTPTELGLYGLLVAVVAYALYFVGFDFYAYSTREMLKSPEAKRGRMLRDQLVLTAILYLIFIPCLLSIFIFNLLPWSFVWWFLALLVLEHWNQEVMRLLIALSAPTLAGWTLFFRSAAWALIVVFVMAFDPSLRNLHFVLLGWVMGDALALVISLRSLRRMIPLDWHMPVDWLWIWKGIRVALPLLISTLAVRGLLTLDRYWVQQISGLEVLGAYVLFMGMAAALLAFLDAGVFTFIYPGMISRFQCGEADSFKTLGRRLGLQTIVVCLVFSGFALFLVGPVIAWLGKDFYELQLRMFPWVLAAIVLYALSMIAHYALYAQGHDRPIIFSHILGFLAFFPVVFWGGEILQILTVPVGLCVAFSLILMWKLMAYWRLTPRQYRFF